MQSSYDNKPQFSKLKKWVKVIQSSIIGVKILELALVVMIGVSTELAFGDNSSKDIWGGILAVVAILYLLISIIQIAYNYHFPADVVDELEAKFDLQKTKKALSRKSEIYEYLSQSISELNNQTCIIKGGTDDAFCNSELAEKFRSVIYPLFIKTNSIFECNNTKFTIGVFLNEHYTLPDLTKGLPKDIGEVVDSRIVMIKNDFDLDINIDLLTDNKATGFLLQLKQSIEVSFANQQYHCADLKDETGAYKFFAIDIPQVCGVGEPQGVMFILAEKICEPDDIEQILDIYSRLVSNLISKYQDCIIDKLEKAGFYRQANFIQVTSEMVAQQTNGI